MVKEEKINTRTSIATKFTCQSQLFIFERSVTLLKEEKINTNLQELGMNLSRSQYKTTLMLTIPRSNQVVYKGFPSDILIVSIRLRRRSTFQSNDALPTQGMIQSDKSLFEKLFTQQTIHFVGFQPGFRLRGVQPLSHA